MEVSKANWDNYEQTRILAIVDGTKIVVGASDSENAYRRAIGDWEAAGNVIGPYEGDGGTGTDQTGTREHGEPDPNRPGEATRGSTTTGAEGQAKETSGEDMSADAPDESKGESA